MALRVPRRRAVATREVRRAQHHNNYNDHRSTTSPETRIAVLAVRREADDQWRVRADKTFESIAESFLLARIEAQNTHFAAEVGHRRKEVAAAKG